MFAETLLRSPFSVIVEFSSGDFAIGWMENVQQLTCHMRLQNHKLLPVGIFSVKIAALGSLKRIFQN